MKLHMIGNVRFDPVWLWTWQERFHEIKATFRSALDRLNETKDFTFICSSASYYAWLEQNEPEMFAEVVARVHEGRWVVVGGWWVQPDCNAPCGESFARQGLLGQRYFQQKLCVMAKTAYNVDSFRHSAMLPPIFRLLGMPQYVMMRPMKLEKTCRHQCFAGALDGSGC